MCPNYLGHQSREEINLEINQLALEIANMFSIWKKWIKFINFDIKYILHTAGRVENMLTVFPGER